MAYCQGFEGNPNIYQLSPIKACFHAYSSPNKRYFQVPSFHNQQMGLLSCSVNRRISTFIRRNNFGALSMPLLTPTISSWKGFSTFSHKHAYRGKFRIYSGLEFNNAIDVINDLGFDTLTFLSVTVMVVPAFKIIKASPILGFFFAGVVLNQFGLIRNLTDVKVLSEWGILFLLFEMGLELSLARLKALAKFAFGMGLTQVVLSTLAFTAFELPPNGAIGTKILQFLFHSRSDLVNIRSIDEAIVIGAALSLSSSAFVLQLLARKGELPTRFGSATLGILLLQDIAVVPLLVILPVLENQNLVQDAQSIWPVLAAESLKALGGLGVLSLGGKFLLRRIFEVVAESRSSEAFVALCLLTVAGTSLLTQKLGFSDTLGAFLAGALLAETNFRTQIEADIRPFRGLLLGLFFVTTGTSIDMQLLFREWPNVLTLLTGLIVIKTIIITAIGPRVGLTFQESVRIGLLLSQGGEFGFVVFSLANRLGVLPLELNKLLIIVVVLSMALTPFLNEVGRKAADFIDEKFQGKEMVSEMANFDASEPVVILGFGQMGQVLANFLSAPLASGLDNELLGWPYVAFDLDRGVVKAARKLGFPVLYGDGSRPAVLQSAGISSPKAVMVMHTGKSKTTEAVQRIQLALPAVNDAVLAGDNLVSCSSDTTIKTWNCFSDGTCTRTLRQHSDYVTCLAAAEKNSNIVSSGGLGGEVFIWDIEAALLPVSKSNDATEDDNSNGIIGPGSSGLPITSLRTISSSSSISLHTTQAHGYSPTAAKGHKESVYALAMNDSGTLLVSGGTEKVLRVWDPRTGSKNMKLRGHTDNIRALLLDSTGRFCLSGSSDSMIRLWDLGQQRCVHSYAVHTDSVWALASTPTFSHVYSGGRDLSLYLTDLATRESLLLCTKEHPILQMTLQDDSIWVATTDSSLHRWPAEGRNPQKVFQKGGSFLAGNLSFTRARACLEGSTPDPVYKEPSYTIPGVPGIVQHEILNNRRQVLTKDAVGSVKLWEITRGIVVEDYGKVSFEEKKEELFEMVSIPAWFTMDTRLGSLSVHLDTPQCFSAEMYAVDLNITGASEDLKVNLAQETLRGLLAHWLAKRRLRCGHQASANGDVPSGKEISIRSHSHSRVEVDDGSENLNSMILPSFEFSTISPPSIITEGSHGGPWRKKATYLDGTEDEKDLPWWCLDCVLNGRIPPRENTKCSFYLHPCEGPTAPVTQGKLSAPRILRVHKVVNYVIEKMLLDKPLDGEKSDGVFASGLTGGQSLLPTIGDGSFRLGLKPWHKLKPSIEILCNNQVLSPEMSLATARAYIWKKPEDLVLNYRVVQGR